MAQRFQSGKIFYDRLKYSPSTNDEQKSISTLEIDHRRPISHELSKPRRIPNNFAQKEKNSEQLLGLLRRARSLKEASERVLHGLESTGHSCSENRKLYIETAHDMLSNLKMLYLDVYNKHRVITARLTQKCECFAVIKSIFAGLIQEARESQTAISRDVQTNAKGLLLHDQHHDFKAQPIISTRTEESENCSLLQRSNDTRDHPVEGHADDMANEMKSAEALLADMGQCSDTKKSKLLLKRREISLKLNELKKKATQNGQEAEMSYRNQLKNITDVYQDLLLLNNELFLAKSHVISLEAECRALEISLKNGNSSLELESRDSDSMPDRILQLCAALRNLELPQTQYRRLCLELHRLFAKVCATKEPSTMMFPLEAETQTDIDCIALKQAIANHASARKNKTSSRKQKVFKATLKSPVVMKEKKGDAKKLIERS